MRAEASTCRLISVTDELRSSVAEATGLHIGRGDVGCADATAVVSCSPREAVAASEPAEFSNLVRGRRHGLDNLADLGFERICEPAHVLAVGALRRSRPGGSWPAPRCGALASALSAITTTVRARSPISSPREAPRNGDRSFARRHAAQRAIQPGDRPRHVEKTQNTASADHGQHHHHREREVNVAGVAASCGLRRFFCLLNAPFGEGNGVVHDAGGPVNRRADAEASLHWPCRPGLRRPTVPPRRSP